MARDPQAPTSSDLHRRPPGGLRARLRSLVASSGALLGSARMAPGCCPPMADPTHGSQLVDPRGIYSTAIAQCRADDLACTKLCAQVFFDGAVPEDTSILGCVLHDHTPAESEVDVDYIVYAPCYAGRRPPGLRAPAAGGAALAASAGAEA
ncbi:MAG TPA: hypothetical protein VHE35_06420, partial [Kofleriaceae bacterium]|nr:hypothetical protein [Kofleriaceae bacterium]